MSPGSDIYIGFFSSEEKGNAEKWIGLSENPLMENLESSTASILY